MGEPLPAAGARSSFSRTRARSPGIFLPTRRERRQRTRVVDAPTRYSLAELAEEALARLGDHDALVFEGRTLRSAELMTRARRMASGLIELGLQRGDRCVVLMANCPEVVITYNAVWRAGAVVTPVVFLTPAAELRHILTDSGAAFIVTTEELLSTVLAAAEDVPTLRHIVVAGGGDAPPADGRVVGFASVESAAESPLIHIDGDELAAVMYT